MAGSRSRRASDASSVQRHVSARRTRKSGVESTDP
jgi:hypothetical protein